MYARIDTGDSVSDLTAPGAVKRIKEKDRLGLGGGAAPMFLTYPAGTFTAKYNPSFINPCVQDFGRRLMFFTPHYYCNKHVYTSFKPQVEHIKRLRECKRRVYLS